MRPAAYPVGEGLVDEVLDRFAPPVAGRRVLVKPNCLAAAEPARAVTTHPSLVRALVRALRRRGAVVAVGDNPGARGFGAARRCFEVSGLLDAAEGAYADIGIGPVLVPVRSSLIDHAVVSRAVLEADVLVTVPKLKTHALTLLTGAVKNQYGILAGAEKARLHREARTPERFASAIADVFAIRVPDLAIMDAVTAMEGDGPSHGKPRPAGLLLASDDPLALDAVAARLVGVEPRRVRHLALAAERGLGAIDSPPVEIDGELRPLVGFRLPSTFRAGVATALANLVVFNALHRSRLRVDVRKCTRCGQCVAACPAEAMRLADGRYLIDTGRCHLCFCCSELCPAGAVVVQGPLGALLRRQGGQG